MRSKFNRKRVLPYAFPSSFFAGLHERMAMTDYIRQFERNARLKPTVYP
jgi:hypothetical protein